MFEGLDARVAPIESADYVVCSGLYDDTVETPQDYGVLIARMRARRLTMVCANPDVVVERGDTLVYCAGAIADLYAAAGGEVSMPASVSADLRAGAGAGRAHARARGRPAARARHRGFGAHRSQGRGRFRIDCLFVTAGIHAEEAGGRETPTPRRSAAFSRRRTYLRKP